MIAVIPQEENVKCKEKQSNELDHFWTVKTDGKEAVAGRDFQWWRENGEVIKFDGGGMGSWLLQETIHSGHYKD